MRRTGSGSIRWRACKRSSPRRSGRPTAGTWRKFSTVCKKSFPKDPMASPIKDDKTKRAARAWIAALALACARSPAAAAERAWGTHMAVGFHYPGFSAKVSYGHAAVEALALREDGADAVGPRLYYLFNPGSRAVFNAGGEYAW